MKTKVLDKLLQGMIDVGRTMHEAKKRRTDKIKVSLLHKTHHIRRDKLLAGSLVRHHMAAVIITDVCGMCDSEHNFVSEIKVWSHSPLKGIDTAQITGEVHGTGMYEFHSDLPLVLSHVQRHVATCPKCLIKNYNVQQDKEDK